VSRAFHRLGIDAILIGHRSVETRPHLACVGIDRKVPRVLLIERMDLEIPHQARLASPDRQQHQAPIDRGQRQSFIAHASRLLRTGRGLQRSHLRGHSDAREPCCRRHRRSQLHTRLQCTYGLRESWQKRVVHADDAALSIHIDLQLCVVDRNAGVTLL
jgi:hypothetical protein